MRWLIGVLLALLVASAQAAWQREEEVIMGTRVRVEAYHADDAVARQGIATVMADMRRIDALMSHYKPDSELSRINAEAAQHPVQVSHELFRLIERALEFSELTGGAFDITYASVGYMYDYRERRRPDSKAIEEALPGINYRHVVLDPEKRTVAFARPGVRIDLGGIAKGYAVERGAMLLRSMGIEHAEVNAGGDSRILGDRVDRPWIVGVRDPRDASRIVAKIPLVDEAISTSGDYERYFEEDGVRYHHIINPRTGGSAHEVRSVSIIGPDAVMTDGLSTSVFVLGVEEGLKLIERMPGYKAIIVDNRGKLHFSKGLEERQP